MQNTQLFTFMLNNEKRGRTKYRLKKKIKNQLQKQNPYLDCLPGLVPVPVSQPRAPDYSHRLQCLSGRWRSRRTASGSVPTSHSNKWRSTSLFRDSETKVGFRSCLHLASKPSLIFVATQRKHITRKTASIPNDVFSLSQNKHTLTRREGDVNSSSGFNRTHLKGTSLWHSLSLRACSHRASAPEIWDVKKKDHCAQSQTLSIQVLCISFN